MNSADSIAATEEYRERPRAQNTQPSLFGWRMRERESQIMKYIPSLK